jgi:hypothetical protein
MRWIVTLFLLFPNLAMAQVNIEKLRSNGTEDGLSGHLGVTAAFTYGNIQFADFGISAHQEYKTKAHSVFWVMNVRFAAKRTQADLIADPSVGLWDKDAHFSNLMLQHLRYNYALTDSIWMEVFTQYEYNEFLLLDRRLIGGLGPRFVIARGNKGAAFFGTSAMIEEERLNAEGIAPSEPVGRIDWRASSYLSATYAPGDDVTWTTTVYFQPRLDALFDYRLVAETGLAFKLTQKVAFTADARLRHDTDPPLTPEGSAAVLGTDMSIKNGIKISW